MKRSTLLSIINHRKRVTVPVAVELDVRSELADLRIRLPDVTGALVATIDGMLVVNETHGLQPETLAAMAAAQLGLGCQFAATAMQGGFQEVVIKSDAGCIAVFAAGTTALLTVFTTAQVNVGRLYHEARPVAVRVAALLTNRSPLSARSDGG